MGQRHGAETWKFGTIPQSGTFRSTSYKPFLEGNGGKSGGRAEGNRCGNGWGRDVGGMGGERGGRRERKFLKRIQQLYYAVDERQKHHTCTSFLHSIFL